MKRVRLCAGSFVLRPISAWDAVRATVLTRKTAARMEKTASCGVSELCDCACMAYLSLYRAGRRAFASPTAVLRALSVEEMVKVQREYLSMMADAQGEDSDELL